MTPTDTKTRLLDAAERLFSHQGFANTSMRAITTEAEANLAAANYHFGSKEELLNAVLERRLLPLNQERSARIDQVLSKAEAAGHKPIAEELLRAFIEPTLAFRHGSSGSRDFISLVGRSMTSADPAVRERFIALVQPLFFKLHQALCRALPQLSSELVFTRLFFVMGAMSHCLCFAGTAQVFETGKRCDFDNDSFLTDHLIRFVTAGLEAPC